MAKTALFVIDIQDELARDPKTRIPAGDRVVDAATTLLDRARSRVNEARSKSEDSNLALIFVQHEESDEGGTLMKGTKPWELVFKPRDGEGHERLVPKQHPNTFETNSQLASQLQAEGVNKIVTCGLQSDICVQATSKGALAEGFDVTVLSGAHSTYDSNGKKAAEIEVEVDKELQDLGASLLPWEQWYP